MPESRRVDSELQQLRGSVRGLLETADPATREAVLASLSSLRNEVSDTLGRLEPDARLGRLGLELARLFTANSAPREFSRVALEAVGQVMPFSKACVLLFDTESGEATILAEQGFDGPSEEDGTPLLPRSLLNELIESRESLLLKDALASHDESSVVSSGIRSVLAAPLVVGDRVEGAIYLENNIRTSVFREPDKLLLESIAQLLLPYFRAGHRLEAAIDERERLEAVLEGGSSYKDIVARSTAMQSILATIERLKDNDAPVLVRGESGTGKELVARALHYSGRRSSGPLVAVNCAAIPEGLMESELFGHERGAFTGATERKIGKFEQAHEGTLFLDEISELRYELQAKLLRALQEQSFERVGGSRTLTVDVRLVAATNRDLKQLVERGEFREDLYYRLDVVPIELPPLRERPEDIPVLLRRFAGELTRQTGKKLQFDEDVIEAVTHYPFPGNVRELKNLVHRLVALAPGEQVGLEDLPEHVTGLRTLSLDKDPFRRFLKRSPQTNEELKSLREEMQQVFDRYLRKVEAGFFKRLLEQTGGNVSEAARRAGMNRTLFHRKLSELDQS